MTLSDVNYMGPSMTPTLKVGDGLSVVPYGDQTIRIGDVVVFHHPEGNHSIVHRVVSIDSEGVRTRGDNNMSLDPWVLQPNEIFGRIVSAQRRDTNVKIHGGIRGRILSPALRTKKHLDRAMSKIFRPAYHTLAESSLIRNCFPLQHKTQVLSFKRPKGTEFQLLLHNRVIARRPAGKNRWHITRPFRLFIDESSLPQ